MLVEIGNSFQILWTFMQNIYCYYKSYYFYFKRYTHLMFWSVFGKRRCYKAKKISLLNTRIVNELGAYIIERPHKNK